MGSRKFTEDSDFVLSKKYGSSLKRVLNENPDGISDSAICKMLDLTQEELNRLYALRITEDSDFVLSKRHGGSLKRVLNENPDGISDSAICKMLGVTQEELTRLYTLAIQKLKSSLTN